MTVIRKICTLCVESDAKLSRIYFKKRGIGSGTRHVEVTYKQIEVGEARRRAVSDLYSYIYTGYTIK